MTEINWCLTVKSGVHVIAYAHWLIVIRINNAHAVRGTIEVKTRIYRRFTISASKRRCASTIETTLNNLSI